MNAETQQSKQDVIMGEQAQRIIDDGISHTVNDNLYYVPIGWNGTKTAYRVEGHGQSLELIPATAEESSDLRAKIGSARAIFNQNYFGISNTHSSRSEDN